MGLEPPQSARFMPRCGPTRIPITMILAWIAVLAAVYFTLVYYPGVLYTDSYGRWTTAQRPFRENPSPELSFVPAVVMALTYDLTNNYATYTLLQSFLFLFSCFLLVHRVTRLPGYWPVLLTIPFLLFPLYPGYSVFHETGIGAVTGLNFAMVIALSTREKERLWIRLAGYVGLFVALVALFGFRLNAVTVVPVLVYLFCRRAPRLFAIINCAVLVSALFAAKYTPRALGSPEADNSGLGFAWEITQVLQRVPNPEYDNYLHYLGNVRGAAVGVEESMWDGFLGPNGINGRLLRVEENSRRVKRDYLKLAWNEPRAFAATKLRVMDRVLGISRPLGFWEFDENRGNEMAKYGCRLTPLRHHAFQKLNAFMVEASFLLRPWVVFLVGLLAYLVGGCLVRPRLRLAGVLYGCSLFYYAAFLITTQSYEFRYFFPSLVLVSTLVFAVLATCMRHLLRKLALAF